MEELRFIEDALERERKKGSARTQGAADNVETALEERKKTDAVLQVDLDPVRVVVGPLSLLIGPRAAHALGQRGADEAVIDALSLARTFNRRPGDRGCGAVAGGDPRIDEAVKLGDTARVGVPRPDEQLVRGAGRLAVEVAQKDGVAGHRRHRLAGGPIAAR